MHLNQITASSLFRCCVNGTLPDRVFVCVYFLCTFLLYSFLLLLLFCFCSIQLAQLLNCHFVASVYCRSISSSPLVLQQCTFFSACDRLELNEFFSFSSFYVFFCWFFRMNFLFFATPFSGAFCCCCSSKWDMAIQLFSGSDGSGCKQPTEEVFIEYFSVDFHDPFIHCPARLFIIAAVVHTFNCFNSSEQEACTPAHILN